MRVELLLAMLLAGCADPAPTPPPPAPPTSVAPVSTDLAALQARLVLPDGATAATWTTTPLGIQGSRAPGPTDVRLVAWVEVDPAQWDTVNAAYGSARPSRGSLTLSTSEAKLLPDAVRPPSEPDGTVRLGGEEYRPDRAGKTGWRVGSIRRVGDAGLWIVAISS